MDKKQLSILLFLIILLIIISGCGTQVTTFSKVTEENKPPEPYTKMLEQLNANDLDMAEKYADLVINDFKDSDYVYNANLLKSIIVSSRFLVLNTKVNYLYNGVQEMILVH